MRIPKRVSIVLSEGTGQGSVSFVLLETYFPDVVSCFPAAADVPVCRLGNLRQV